MATESQNELAHKIKEQERLLEQAQAQAKPNQQTIAQTELEIRRLKNLRGDEIAPAREVEFPESLNQGAETLRGVDKELTAEELAKKDDKDGASVDDAKVIKDKAAATGKAEDVGVKITESETKPEAKTETKPK